MVLGGGGAALPQRQKGIMACLQRLVLYILTRSGVSSKKKRKRPPLFPPNWHPWKQVWSEAPPSHATIVARMALRCPGCVSLYSLIFMRHCWNVTISQSGSYPIS